MATTIVTKYGSDAPAASDIVRGELAVDTENGRLYTENAAGAVVEIGLKPEANVDVTGTITASGVVTANAGVVVDNITIDGTTLTSTDDFIVDASSDINLDAGGGQVRLKGSGSTFVTFNVDATPEVLLTGGPSFIGTTTSDAALTIFGSDGGSNVNALVFDMSAAGAATFNSTIAATSATFTTADNNPQLTLISTDADANAGPLLVLDRNSASPADSDVLGHLKFQGKNDAAEGVVYSEILTLASDVSDGTEEATMYIQSMVAGTVREKISILPNETVFNENSIDLDFRVESNNNANMLFVDGGNDAVGVGTGSPSGSGLHVYNSTGGEQYISSSNSAMRFVSTGGINYIQSGTATSSSSAAPLVFTNVGGSGETMRIDSSGNVGIGVVPSASHYTSLEIGNSGSSITGRGAADTHFMSGLFWDAASTYKYSTSSVAVGSYQITNGIHYWATAAAGTAGNAATPQTNMTLSASGNLLVGKTAASFGTAGVAVFGGGEIDITSTNEAPLFLNRLGSDGVIQYFYKDGTAVGSIGSTSGYLFIGGTAGSDAFLSFGESGVRPATSAGAARDAAIDLGGSTNRYKDIYTSGGIFLGGAVAANKLDDYEEGHHEPTVAMSTSGTITLSTSYDRFSYTKIGRLVTITGNPRISSVSSPVGTVSFTLPFAAASGATDEKRSGGVIRYYDNSAGSGSYNKALAWQIVENTSTLVIDNVNTDGSNLTPAASDEFYFSLSYITA